jgi:hypothetical protein
MTPDRVQLQLLHTRKRRDWNQNGCHDSTVKLKLVAGAANLEDHSMKVNVDSSMKDSHPIQSID